MKIKEAKLCVNCEEVFSYFDSKNGCCPVCGSCVTIFVVRAWTEKKGHGEKIKIGEEEHARVAN